jgi:acylphosphatase
MKKLLKVKILGRVQGVFFRAETKRKADELGLAGFVRNEPDGTVYVEAEGEEKNLREFLKWCREGPEISRVEKIESEFSEKLKNHQGFKIAY